MKNFIESAGRLKTGPFLIEIIEFNTDCFNENTPSIHGIRLPECLKNAVTQRKAEYTAGRIAAGRQLASCGISAEIPMNRDRSPAWPPGFTGSITHDKNITCAVASLKKESFYNLGIDLCISATGEDMKNIAGLISTPEERKSFISCSLSEEDALRIIFSAKESLYKAVYPEVKRFIDFKEVTIAPASGDNEHGKVSPVAVSTEGNTAGIIQKYQVYYRRFRFKEYTGFLTLASPGHLI